MTSRRRRLAGANIFRRRRGATAIEFAIIAVPFLGLLAAIFETGFVFFENAQLQEVTETASRTLLTNAASSGMTYNTFLTQNVCPKLASMINCSKLQMEVDVLTATTWNSATNYTLNNIFSTNYSSSAALPIPAPGQIAIVRIVYPMTPIAAVLTGGAFGGGGAIRKFDFTSGSSGFNMLMGIYAFKVEP
jgi:Flp pilus assembly protein TadG